VLAVLVAAGVLLPIPRLAQGLVNFVGGLGGWGILLWGGISAAAMGALLPGTILTVGAGFLFGFKVGFLLQVPASTLGAFIAFQVGRSVSGPWLKAKVQGHPRYSVLYESAEKEGFRFTLLLRLSPLLPFNVINYTLGASPVNARAYVAGTFIGIVPLTAFLVYVGTIITAVTDLSREGLRESGAIDPTMIAIGGVATLIVVVLLARYAHVKLTRPVTARSQTR
jgi:uncharacterized membrane protein YdjX (TVP38/TMEM64 family)